MRFWINVETAAGVVVGDGPIVSATYWRHAPRLDAAGEWEFQLPASDPKAALLTNKRVVRCYGIVGGAVTELGAGVIDRHEIVLGQPTMLRVSGLDLLCELSRRSVRDLSVCQLEWTSLNDGRGKVAQMSPVEPYPNYEATVLDEAFDGDPATYDNAYMESCSDPGMPEDATWLYVGYDARFDAAEFTFIDGFRNNNASTLDAQYFDGSAWQDLAVTDGTESGGATWAQDGVVSWTRPADIQRVMTEGGNWFWIRFRVNYSDGQITTDTCRLAEVRVYADQPTTNGVNLIMAHAPDDWVKSGYPATSKEAYLQFEGESVLSALIALTEQTGDHFRLSASGREIDWLTSYAASGLRAVAAADPVGQDDADELVLITELTRVIDTMPAISRIIPTGANGLTLANTTKTAPAGYTLDAANNYIQRDSAYAAWGVIEEWVPFPEIGVQQYDSTSEHPEMAADALFEAAYQELRKRSDEEEFYSLTVGKAAAMIRPGETLWIDYDEWVDGYHSVALHNTLKVNGATTMVDEQGVHTVALEIATIDRMPMTDESVLVATLRNVQEVLKTVSMRNPLLHQGDVVVGLAGGTPGRVPGGGAGQTLTYRDGMPTWATKRRIAVSGYEGAVTVDTAPVTFLVVPPGWPASAVEWRLHLDTAGGGNTTVTVTKNGGVIATCTLGAAATDGSVTLSESLAAGDVLARQITAAGAGAAGINCALVCEEA